jgi:hypothetical protein
MLIFFKWLCAHLLGDFTFQTRAMVLHKRKHKALSKYLYLHVGIHAALIYLFTGWWGNWQLPLIVAVTHFGIDWWKLYRKDILFYFLLDQCLHIAVLGGLWWWYQAADRAAFLSECRLIVGLPSVWIVASAYIFIIWPCALVLGYLTGRWREAVERMITPERPPQGGPGSPSLSEAGKWIGIFERTLVLTFILTNHYEGIGFLIAAKSILRFSETKGRERAETEYILIGTLMSFSASILTGMLCRYLLMN